MRGQAKDLSGVLNALYDGMLDDGAWQRALLILTDFVSGSGVALFSMNPSTGRMYRLDLARLDAEVMRQYGDAWINNDPRHAASLTCAIGQPQVDGMLVSTRDYQRTAVFNELLRPADAPYHLATWVERSPNRGVVLTVQGTWTRGVFTEEERRRMSVLIPHIRRIVEVKDRLARAQVTTGALLETMDRLPFGVLLIAENWEILEASAAAQSLLRCRAGMHDDNGRLGFIRGADERAFAARLKEDPNLARLDDIVSVTRPGFRHPLSLLVLPLKSGQEQWLRPAARWLILVFDPEQAPPLPERVLQQALGISPAEAALARHIATGASVAQAASQLGVSLNTVRAQLKSIYAKTGVNSQAQLVRRILTSPVLVNTLGGK